MAQRLIKEEKVAAKLIDLVNDITLDLDEVGVYLSRQGRTVSINRLVLIIDAALEERDK
jgi:hypothetical protein